MADCRKCRRSLRNQWLQLIIQSKIRFGTRDMVLADTFYRIGRWCCIRESNMSKAQLIRETINKASRVKVIKSIKYISNCRTSSCCLETKYNNRSQHGIEEEPNRQAVCQMLDVKVHNIIVQCKKKQDAKKILNV